MGDCCGGTKLIFACSGAADVGKISDLSARKLTEQGLGKMFCLAGVGGRVDGIMKTTETADAVLAIDGCSLDCAKKTLEQAGFTDIKHARVTDMGFEKGSTEVSEDNVNTVVVTAAKAGGLTCC